MRVQKEWLRGVVERDKWVGGEEVEELAPVGIGGKGKEVVNDDDNERVLDEERILWVSPAKNTGLKFRIREKKFRRDVPILVDVDEELPVSYEIEYEGRSASRIFSYYIYLSFAQSFSLGRLIFCFVLRNH